MRAVLLTWVLFWGGAIWMDSLEDWAWGGGEVGSAESGVVQIMDGNVGQPPPTVH